VYKNVHDQHQAVQISNGEVMEIKTYVLDTNVLLSDPTAIFSFDEHHVIIPMIVLEELDRHKSRPDEVGRNARLVSRNLDGLREKGSLLQGISLDNGGKLSVMQLDESAKGKLPLDLRPDKPDNLIIGHALVKAGAILVSKDINVRIKCDSLGIRCEDYLKMRIADDPQKFYRGVDLIEVPENTINEFFRNGKMSVAAALGPDYRAYPNQICIMKHVENGETTHSAITKCVGENLVQIARIDQAFGLKPRNKEQAFSLDLLFDPDIKLLTLVGPSGTGKTLLALASALEQLKGLGDQKARYDKLIVTRPVQPVGKDIGFLPGTLEEKMEPWIAPIRDNLNFLMDQRRSRPKKTRDDRGARSRPAGFQDSYLQVMQDRGLIEIEAISFIRGRSIPNAFIVIDEAQNLSMHELKTIITRVGDGTKIVLTGDIEQIDNVHVDVFTNGLSYAVERFKEYPISGHVSLIKGERSDLATLASKIL
jgi:PhoH-like ATPase